MSFEAFIGRHRGLLFAHFLLDQWHPGSCSIEAPYPPSFLSEDEQEALKIRLLSHMPSESIILDLWNSDCRFENDLGEDWFYGAAFGCNGEEKWLTDSLVEYFLCKAVEYTMDCGQPYDSLELEETIEGAAHSFIQQWRSNLYKHLGNATETGEVK